MADLHPIRRICSACGNVHVSRVKPGETRPRRWVKRCTSKQCKGRRRAHYPLFRPITGAYVGAEEG